MNRKAIRCVCCALFLLMPTCMLKTIAAQKTTEKKRTESTTKTNPSKDFVVNKSLDPTGRPDVKSLLGSNFRYYVYFVGDQWRLRTTTAKYTRRFEGVIRVKNGKFRKVRPIGIDKKTDKWELSRDRTQLTFDLKTKKKFDGFDFQIIGENDAVVQFDLKTASVRRPKTIFIGNKLKHPRQTKFSFPAKPKPKPNPKNTKKSPPE